MTPKEVTIPGPHGYVKITVQALGPVGTSWDETTATCLAELARRSVQHRFHQRLDEDIVEYDIPTGASVTTHEVGHDSTPLKAVLVVNLADVAAPPEMVAKLLRPTFTRIRNHIMGHLVHPNDHEAAHSWASDMDMGDIRADLAMVPPLQLLTAMKTIAEQESSTLNPIQSHPAALTPGQHPFTDGPYLPWSTRGLGYGSSGWD